MPALVAAAGVAAARAWAAFPPGIANPSTRRCYASAARRFLDHLAAIGGPPLLAVTPADAAAWLEAGAAALSAATLRQRRVALDLLLRALDDLRGDRTSAAASGVPRPRVPGRPPTPTRTLTADEAGRLLASVPTADPIGIRDRAMLALLLRGGLRVSALLALRAADLRRGPGGLAVVVRGATAEERRVLSPDTALALADHLAASPPPTPDAPVFRSAGRGAGRRAPTSLAQADVYRTVRRRAAAAGIVGRVGGDGLRLSGQGDEEGWS